MKKQEVKIFLWSNDIENRINRVIKEYNEQGWFVKQITSHAQNHSYWCLLFEKEVEDNAD